MKIIISSLFFLFFTSVLFAKPIRVGNKKINSYIQNGVFIGGESKKEEKGAFSLMSIRRNYSPKRKQERLVFDMGDSLARPLKGDTNYFHIEIQRKSKRILVSLAQVIKSGVDKKLLNKILRKSKLIKSGRISYDPIDFSTNFIFYFKGKVQVEAFTVVRKNSESRIVIDIQKI